MEFIRRNVNASSRTPTTTSSGGGYKNNVASGGMLETHTIFSQPFNGTNDVKGDLADVDKITANGDISTDGKFIIKGIDTDGIYTDKDLNVSLDDTGTQIEGGKEYFFDGTVNAPVFVGDVDSELINADVATVGELSATNVIVEEDISAQNVEVADTLNTYELGAIIAEINKIISDDIEVDNLTVKKAAHFFSLIIDEIKSVGGQLIISPANATFDKVVADGSNYKCYFRAEDGDKKIDNQFEVNDQAVCQTFNGAEGENFDVSNKFYWRLVLAKGTEELGGIKYHYIILSDSDKDSDSNGVPTEGDKVALLGNRSDTSRQNAIIISAYSSAFLDSGITAPFIVQYSGVNNYNLYTHRNSIISNGKNLFTGDFVLTSGESVEGQIAQIKETANDISMFVQEPDQVNMFEGSNGYNYGCWKVTGVSVNTKSGTDYILVLGGSNNGGYILQPSKYFVTTNKVNVSLDVSELQGLSSYYSMEICDKDGTVISNKVNLGTGSKTYAFTLTKVPNSIIHLKISLIAGSRFAFKNEKALMESVPKRISGIEVDIDSITSRVSGAEGQISTINQTVNQINSKVTGMEGNISQIAQKADSIESTVSNIQVGGRNLIDDSEFNTYLDKTDSTWIKKNAIANISYGYMNQIGIHHINTPSNNGSEGYLDMAQQKLTYKLKPDTYYTFSFYAKGSNGVISDNGTNCNYKGRITTYVYPNVGSEVADNAHSFTLTNEYKRYSYTFKTKADLDEAGNYYCLFRLIKTEENGVSYYSNAYICMPKLEEGTMATAWETNEADMKSYVTQKADLIESKIVTEDTINSKISQSTTNIKAEVYNELNESTGIDIASGIITLNADKTVFNGNINMRNADEGLVVYDNEGNASVVIQNKKIPQVSNLDQPAYNYISTATFNVVKENDNSFVYFTSEPQKIGNAKVGDNIILYEASLLFSYKDSSNKVHIIPLSSISYLECQYVLTNTTTGSILYSPLHTINTAAEEDWQYIPEANFEVTEDGDYEVYLDIAYTNPSIYDTYYLVWEFHLGKLISQYTQIGTDGFVSVQDKYKYLYFGKDGLEARMSFYNGFRVTNNYCQQVLGENDGVTLWGSLVSKCQLSINPKTVSMTVKAGDTTIGTRNVVRADSEYYDIDMFIIREATSEIWIKLPCTLIELDGINYYIGPERIIKVRNLTSQKCYVYVSDASYKIYDSSGTSGVYYLSVGSGSAEFVFDGKEWVRM